MKRLLLALLFVCSAAYAQDPISVEQKPDGTTVITMSAAQARLCQEQGGCKIFTPQEFLALLQHIKPHLCSQLGV